MIAKWFIKKFVDLQGSKYIRHVIAAIGAWMVTKGVDADAENLVSLFTGLFTILFSVVWSALVKTAPSEHWKAVLTKFAAALARQLQTAIATFVALDPNALSNDTVTTSAVLMAVLNLIISRIDASDNKPIQLNPDGSRP